MARQNWISRIFSKKPERRELRLDWMRNLGVETTAGVSVTELSALQSTAVYACVRLLAETVASLPLITYRRLENGGKERALDHPLYDVLHYRPNRLMSSFEWRETMMGHLLLWGNAYSRIVDDASGRVVELYPMRPDRVQISQTEAGLMYTYSPTGGEVMTLPEEKVFHLRGLSTEGILGISPIAQARQAIGLALATEEFGSRFFGNGARPGGVLEHPGTLTDEAMNRLRMSWEQSHTGAANAHKVAILEEGMKYAQIGIPPEDAQFLETRKFQLAEIARIFRVPAHMIGDLDRATFSNIEHQSLEFVIHSVRPWLVRWEQAIMRSLLMEHERNEVFAEFLVDGLLRGDTMSRYQAYATAVTNGWMSRNEVRQLENLNPVDGLDEYLVPMNMMEAGADLDGLEDERSAVVRETRSVEFAETEQAAEDEAVLEERARRVNSRYRLMRSYRRVIRSVAERLVRREAQDLLTQAEKNLRSQRGSGMFELWLEEYWRKDQEYIRQQMEPTLLAYGELVANAVEGETKQPADPDAVQRFMKAYVETYAERHVYKSKTRLETVYRRALERGEDPVEAIRAEMEEWTANRADAIAEREAVQANGAVAVMLFKMANVQVLRWYAMGNNACPYCQGMNGKIVEISRNFADEGDDLDGGDDGHLVISHGVGHPPLHEGCECMVGIG